MLVEMWNDEDGGGDGDDDHDNKPTVDKVNQLWAYHIERPTLLVIR